MLIPLADKRELSGITSKLLTIPPKELTSATPETVRSAGRITQSNKSRRSIKLKSPPSTVNINISPKGVVIGAMPPCTPAGKFPHIVFKRSAICCLAQKISVPSSKSTVISVNAYLATERNMV